MDNPLRFSNQNLTIYQSFEGLSNGAFGFLQKSFFDDFLEKPIF
jgi:hypothetical protein